VYRILGNIVSPVYLNEQLPGEESLEILVTLSYNECY